MSENFDVAVIGSGPGGYAAAIRCAQRKASVAIIEKAAIGGTCLNVGCIPSKALLASAHTLLTAKNAGAMGIDIISAAPDWQKIQARKNSVVTAFVKGLTGLLAANKIKIFRGRGIVTSPGVIKIETDSGPVEISAKKIILATGSKPVEIPSIPFDGQTVISSTEALELSAIPESMVIIGGGVIGCEMACVYAVCGTKVTIIEALDRLLPNEDEWVGRLLERELKKLGITVLTGQKVTAVDKSVSPAKVVLETSQTVTGEKVLVAVGRVAVCDSETIQALKLEMSGRVLKVDRKLQTSAAGVYAIGDAVGTTYLAHGAFAEAEIAAANATGSDETIADYSLVPRAVYTFPEVASVGKTEEKCRKEGLDVSVGKSSFRANGRSAAHNETAGEIRVVTDNATNTILGVTIVHSTATEMIAAARMLIGADKKITEISFAHPTFSEVLKEAAEDAFGLSLHNPPKA